MTLEIRDLSKRYGNKWVLRDVSFDVEPGEVFAILGASKSGKSTLIRILTGREKPSPPEKQFGIDDRSSLWATGIFKPREPGSFLVQSRQT